MFLPKVKRASTFFKYLLSYVLVFTVLIAGFFLILRSQLSEAYRSQQAERIQAQMEALGDHLKTELTGLLQIDDLIIKNPDVKIATYQTDSKYFYYTNNALAQYAASSQLINTVIYYSRYNGQIFSSEVRATYDGTAFTLTDSSNKRFTFDPTPYMNASDGQLIWLDNSRLLYFPQNKDLAKFLYFYVLDTWIIQSQLKSLVSEEVPAVALLDSSGNYVTGHGFYEYASQLQGSSFSPGIHPLEDGLSLFVSDPIMSGFHMVTAVSGDYLAHQVDTAFVGSYLGILGLSLVGFILIYVAMQLTYRPLRRLVTAVIREPGKEKNYLALLQENYSELSGRNLELQQRLAGYRQFVQRDLLGSILTQQYSLDHSTLDRLFEALSNAWRVVAIMLSQTDDHNLRVQVAAKLKGAVGPRGNCFLLQRKNTVALYLVLFQTESDQEAILDVAQKLQEEQGLFFAFSDTSDNVMDIPALLKDAETASSHWPDEPLARFRKTDPVQPQSAYPHDDLNQLAVMLKLNKFSTARDLVDSLFARFDSHTKEISTPAYFLSCIILDCLTIITNSMNKVHIEFDTYADVFTEAVHHCRSLHYSQNFEILKSLINELLFFYEKEAMDRLLHVTPLQQYVESKFCDPNFSITEIAEAYHVSPSRMSTLFKKEMGVGFMEYVLKMRLEKAQELLRTTELSVDEISLQVGYLASTSFSRKFKQETGLTPSQYRSKFTTSGEDH